jgi:hypothetical protein
MGSSISYEPRFIKQRSLVRIPLPLSLCGHVKKKKKMAHANMHANIYIHIYIYIL